MQIYVAIPVYFCLIRVLEKAKVQILNREEKNSILIEILEKIYLQFWLPWNLSHASGERASKGMGGERKVKIIIIIIVQG